LNTQVLGISVDSTDSLRAWAESFGGISYPLLSDFWPHGAVAEKYGVLRREGKSERALFVLDRWGIIRYIDIHDIDKQPDNEILLGILRRIDPEAAARMPVVVPPVSTELPHGGIVMYCTSWCPGCRRARAWFQSRNLKYIEIDIDTNPAAVAQVKKWNNGNRSTPTFDIEGTILSEFNETKMLETLKQHNLI
jgi:glutaredoxin